MRVRVKICGLTDPTDRDAAVAAGADALGFISGVPVETPRERSLVQVAALVADIPPFVTSVLVTAPDSVEQALARCERAGTDAIQLHGGLSPDEIADIHKRTDAAVIAAVGIDDEDIDAYARVADGLLVDSAAMGGTGEIHDWTRTRDLREAIETPVILAGGLTPENVAAGIREVSPFAVDVASGVEHTDGKKNHDAIRSFVARTTEVTG